jgi:hypothetical protein
MRCLNCFISIKKYLGIKNLESTNPAGWVEMVTRPVQLCIDCAAEHFDDDDIVEWDDSP